MSASNVVERAAEILTVLADTGERGARLVDVARRTGIARPTVHRILGDLLESGLADQTADRRYRLGALTFALGQRAPLPLQQMDALQALANELADRTTVTCYIGMLQRRRVTYVARAQGSSPIHIYSVEVGASRPLPTTHAGIALLSTFSDEEQASFLEASAIGRARQGSEVPLTLDVGLIWQKVRELREVGYLFGRNLASPGVSGMAALVPAGPGAPTLAVTVTAVHAELTDTTARRFAPMLLETVAAMSEFVT